jgi:hypothetical protein
MQTDRFNARPLSKNMNTCVRRTGTMVSFGSKDIGVPQFSVSARRGIVSFKTGSAQGCGF